MTQLLKTMTCSTLEPDIGTKKNRHKSTQSLVYYTIHQYYITQ